MVEECSGVCYVNSWYLRLEIIILLRVRMVILTVILIKLTVVGLLKDFPFVRSWQHGLFDGTYSCAFIWYNPYGVL